MLDELALSFLPNAVGYLAQSLLSLFRFQFQYDPAICRGKSQHFDTRIKVVIEFSDPERSGQWRSAKAQLGSVDQCVDYQIDFAPDNHLVFKLRNRDALPSEPDDAV